MVLEKPIFLLGLPRAGVSLALDVLCAHRDLAWVPNWVNTTPEKWQRARVRRLYDLPILGRKLYLAKDKLHQKVSVTGKAWPMPFEPWYFWQDLLEQFNLAPQERWNYRLPAEAMSDKEVVRCRERVDELTAIQGKKRFVSMYAELPRFHYLSKAFGDALFVHITRDPRAIINSWIKGTHQGYYLNWERKEIHLASWPEEWRKQWRAMGSDLCSFLAFQYRFYIDEIWRESEEIGGRYYQLAYEDLAERKKGCLEGLLDFCQLRAHRSVVCYYKQAPIKNNNHKWPTDLTQEEQAKIAEVLSGQRYQSLFR